MSILLEVNGWADRWTYELLGVDLRHCIVTPSCRTCSLSRPCATIATTQSCYISGLDRTQALGIFGLLRPPVIVAVCCTRHINKYVDTVTSLELGRTFNLLLVIRALNYGIICLTILNRLETVSIAEPLQNRQHARQMLLTLECKGKRER